MASTNSALWKIELQTTGENSGTWGTIANTDFSLIEEAVDKNRLLPITATSGAYVLDDTAWATSQARAGTLVFSGALALNTTGVIPSRDKHYTVRNITTATFALTIWATAGSSLTIPQGFTVQTYCDGTNIYPVSPPTSTTYGILVGTGSVSAPGLSLIGDTDSGFYTTGPNTMALALGATSVMKFDPLGHTATMQPAFLAFVATTNANVTGSSTTYVVPFDLEVYDQGGNYSTGVFTAPVTGKYQLNTTIEWTGTATTHTSARLQITSSNRSYFLDRVDLTAPSQTIQSIFLKGSALVDMDAGDTATVGVTFSGAPSSIDIVAASTSVLSSMYSGSLIC